MTKDKTDCVNVVTDVMHTPALRPGLDPDLERDVMRVLHTPVLRPACTLNTFTNNTCNNSGARIVTRNGDIDIDVPSGRYRPDMRKLATSNGSPKFAVHNINMDKTPTVLGGRKEHFGSITDMILHWEGMEEEEEGREICREGGGGRKRLSQRISELSGKFEEGRDSASSSQPGAVCKEGEEGLETSFVYIRNQNLTKLSGGLEDIQTNKLVGNLRPTFLLSSNPNNISTNESSPPILRNKLTNQKLDRGVKRKGNWTKDQGGLLLGERRVVSKVCH